MRADSTLSESQREELVALFEQGFGSWDVSDALKPNKNEP